MTLILDRPSFWAAGACRELPPEWFHPGRGESTRDAKAVCATCPVRPECFEWAVTRPEKFGIWGGTSERERRRIRRDRGLVDPADPDSLIIEPEEEPTVDLTIADPSAPTPTNGSVPGRSKRPCEECGDPYYPVRTDQRFCSKVCRKARAKAAGPPAVRKPRVARATPPARTGPVDVQVLLGQLLAGCDRWTVEADLGDVHVTVSRSGR